MPREIKTCLFCQATQSDISLFTVVRGWRYLRCKACGLIFLNPMPTEDELSHFYNESYAYDRERYRESVARQGEWLQLLGSFRDGRARLLEIGCSYGYFLAAARERGWDVQGIELSERAGRFACQELGLRVITGRVSDCAENLQTPFDVIVAWHVLEHDLEPHRFLHEIFQVLRPGGVLTLRVPNVESAAARLAGAGWQWLSPPEHAFMYSRRTLNTLLSSCGFEILHARTARGNARNLWFEILRARSKALLLLGRKADGRAERFSFAPPAVYENRLWYRVLEETISLGTKPFDWLMSPWLARHGWEAELVVVARKPDSCVFSSPETQSDEGRCRGSWIVGS
jgi:SAM-dependent methyltransferase